MFPVIKKQWQRRRLRRFTQTIEQRPSGREFRSLKTAPSNESPRVIQPARKPTQARWQLTKRQMTDLAAALGSLLLISAAGWYLAFVQGSLDIEQVTIEGNQFIATEAISSTIDSYLNSKAFRVVPRRSFVAVDTEDLRERILAAHADDFALESVTVNKDFPDAIRVTVHERVPRIAWVTKSPEGKESFYLVDHEGFVTQELAAFDQLDPAFPRVRDDNRPSLGIGWQIVSPDYIAFLLNVEEAFADQTGLTRDSYILPKIDCSERQYVAERILEQEIADSETDASREQKIQVQERFLAGELSVDESLAALEEIKNAEQPAGEPASDTARVEWQTVSVPVECDLVRVATDLQVRTTEADNGFVIYLDTLQSLEMQLANLRQVIETGTVNRAEISYVDVRLPDRVYYQ
jgi:cell division septal protein FtsQ